MSTAQGQAHPPADIQTTVSSDATALASHMSDCHRSNGPFLPLLSLLERVRAAALGRIVTTGALVGATGLCLLLVFS